MLLRTHKLLGMHLRFAGEQGENANEGNQVCLLPALGSAAQWVLSWPQSLGRGHVTDSCQRGQRLGPAVAVKGSPRKLWQCWS